MFARVLALVPFALLASASVKVRDGSSQCDTGSISCCNSVQDLNQANSLLGSLGLVTAAASVGGLVGLTCSPLTVVGVAGNSCTQQTVCCENDNFNGLVNLGCSPINLNL